VTKNREVLDTEIATEGHAIKNVAGKEGDRKREKTCEGTGYREILRVGVKLEW